MKPSNQFSELIKLMAHLRANCPWDAKQSNQSLQKYALEEVYELIESINLDDKSDHATDAIKGELGDVLLQVVFHAHLYDEQGRFDMADVIYHLTDKLIRRHPHVFDTENLNSEAEVKKRWDEIKAIENSQKPKRLLSQVKAGTALSTAQNLQTVAGDVGFDWEVLGEVVAKLDEEIGELKAELPDETFGYKTQQLSQTQIDLIEDELGDCLFALTNLARHVGIDSEMALQKANAKFQRRFGFVEQALINNGKTFADVDLTQMDAYWEQAKAQERQTS